MKKRLIMFLIAASFSASAIFSGCGSDDVATYTSAEDSYISADIEVASEENVPTAALEWNAAEMTALAGIVSGIGGEIDGYGGIREIRALLNYNASVVKGVTFDTSGVNFGTAGTYDVPYSITFDRDALLGWMEENDIDMAAYPGLDAAESPRIRVNVASAITVTSDAEIVSEGAEGDSGANETENHIAEIFVKE